jgi:hypothetical protein
MANSNPENKSSEPNKSKQNANQNANKSKLSAEESLLLAKTLRAERRGETTQNDVNNMTTNYMQAVNEILKTNKNNLQKSNDLGNLIESVEHLEHWSQKQIDTLKNKMSKKGQYIYNLVTSGGKKKKKVVKKRKPTGKKKVRKIHKGPRGGRYYISKGRKVYL